MLLPFTFRLTLEVKLKMFQDSLDAVYQIGYMEIQSQKELCNPVTKGFNCDTLTKSVHYNVTINNKVTEYSLLLRGGVKKPSL